MGALQHRASRVDAILILPALTVFLLCLKAEAPAHPWLLWETSLHRRGAVGIAIYAVALVFLYSINAENAVLSALVPAVAYFLSTLTLPFLKGMWLKNVYKK